MKDQYTNSIMKLHKPQWNQICIILLHMIVKDKF